MPPVLEVAQTAPSGLCAVVKFLIFFHCENRVFKMGGKSLQMATGGGFGAERISVGVAPQPGSSCCCRNTALNTQYLRAMAWKSTTEMCLMFQEGL